MIVEWECTLACNFKCDYCTNGRNSVLPEPIKAVTDEVTLESFIRNTLKPLCRDSRLFLFGGEPTLHPKIGFIVETLKKYSVSFIIQTNFSNPELVISLDCPTNVSIHDEMSQSCYPKLAEVKNLESVDVMFDSIAAIERLKYAQQFTDVAKLVPVCDFDGSQRHLRILHIFNTIKKANIAPCEMGDRSFVWEKMLCGELTTIGNPCIYKDKYILFDPSLRRWHCSHRIDAQLCRYNCFLM